MTQSYLEQQASIIEFAERVPRLLARRPETADLSLKLAELDIPAAMADRFTVAIVGQMRVGKSTLLNALIGRQLAPTGVNETTATVNWFRFGTGEACESFRVHWLDGSTEDFAIDNVENWVGRSDNAQKTRWIDFFAPSEFLNIANIVDTPGTRSVVDGHEETIHGFLSEKLERETLRYGGRADAVIYAINPVARGKDQELLEQVGQRTRLAGASAYNSIAVVQKWEHLRPDPFAEAERMCERLRDQLIDRVSAVVPVSGLLALTIREASVEQWHQIAQLANSVSEDDFEDLTSDDQFFLDDWPDLMLAVEHRRTLLAVVPWPIMRFSLWLARTRRLTDGNMLINALDEASGIKRLGALLETRFFALAGLIKAGTALRKAWEPCRVGLLSLREELEKRRALLKAGKSTLEGLSAHASCGSADDEVRTFLERSIAMLDSECGHIATTLVDIEELVHHEEQTFRLLDADLAAIGMLESIAELSGEEQRELRLLFGQAGSDVMTRLDLTAGTTAFDAIDRASNRHLYWSRQQGNADGALRRVTNHAIERLDLILDLLEADSGEGVEPELRGEIA